MNMNTMNTSTSMSASIQQAIFENNEGTRLVRHCEYDAAVKSFTVVLEILKPLAVIVEEQKHKQNARYMYDDGAGSSDNDATSAHSAPLTISFTNKSAMDTESCDDSNEMNDNKTTTTTTSCCTSSSSSSPSASRTASVSSDHSTKRKLKHFVFRDPVIIPTESIPSATSSSLSKFLMIVMYNLALTLHLHALSSSRVSSSHKKKQVKKLFVRSRQLYELALKMHLELEEDIDPLFTLALTNNLGLIYRTMNEKVRSKICFQNMFSTMMYLLDSSQHEDTSTPQSIHMDIWDGLLSNAMNILHKHTYEVAAAAA